MNNKLEQVPEEFKQLAKDFSEKGFITTSTDNLINLLAASFHENLYRFYNL